MTHPGQCLSSCDQPWRRRWPLPLLVARDPRCWLVRHPCWPLPHRQARTLHRRGLRNHFGSNSFAKLHIAFCCVAAMTSIRDVVAELNHMIDWHHTQVGCGLDAKTCADNQMQSLLSRVRSFGTISTDDATLLVSTIRDNALSDWSPDQIAEICTAVGEKTGVLTNAKDKISRFLAKFAFLGRK